jgi:hypothetical protein
LVARFVRDEEAVGSNPATPTRKRLVKDVFSTADDGDSLPLAQEVIDLFTRMEQLQTEGPEE